MPNAADWRASLGALSKKRGRRRKTLCKQLKTTTQPTSVASATSTVTLGDASLLTNSDNIPPCAATVKRRRGNYLDAPGKENRNSQLASDIYSNVADSVALDLTESASQPDPSQHTFRAQEFDDESRWEGPNHCRVSSSDSQSKRSDMRPPQKSRKKHRKSSQKQPLSCKTGRSNILVAESTQSSERTLSLDESPTPSVVPIPVNSLARAEFPASSRGSDSLVSQTCATHPRTINYSKHWRGKRGREHQLSQSETKSHSYPIPARDSSIHAAQAPSSAPIQVESLHSGRSVSANNWKEMLAKTKESLTTACQKSGLNAPEQSHTRQKRSASTSSTASAKTSFALRGSERSEGRSHPAMQRITMATSANLGTFDVNNHTAHTSSALRAKSSDTASDILSSSGSPTLLASPLHKNTRCSGDEEECSSDSESVSLLQAEQQAFRTKKSEKSTSDSSLSLTSVASSLQPPCSRTSVAIQATVEDTDNTSVETLSPDTIDRNDKTLTNQNGVSHIGEGAHLDETYGASVSSARRANISVSQHGILVPQTRSDQTRSLEDKAAEKPFNPRQLLGRSRDFSANPSSTNRSISLLSIAREHESARQKGRNNPDNTCRSKKNGMSGCLEHAINKRMSQARIWNDGISTGECLTVCVMDVYTPTYGVVFARCGVADLDTDVGKDEDENMDEDPVIYVLLDQHTAALLSSTRNSVLQIYKPWHMIEVNAESLRKGCAGVSGMPSVRDERDIYEPLNTDGVQIAGNQPEGIGSVIDDLSPDRIVFPSRCIVYTPRWEAGDDCS